MDTAVMAWIVASAIATAIAAAGVREAIADLRALALIVNGRRAVAFMHLRNQAGRLVVGIAWTLLGIPSLFDDRPTPWSLGIAILVGSNVILTVNAALDLRARRRLLAPADEPLSTVAELTAVADARTEDIKQTIRDNAPERGQRGFRGDEGERGPRGHRGGTD